MRDGVLLAAKSYRKYEGSISFQREHYVQLIGVSIVFRTNSFTKRTARMLSMGEVVSLALSITLSKLTSYFLGPGRVKMEGFGKGN